VKGVKGRGKSQSSLLQPFVPLQICWSGKGEVKTLTQYEANGKIRQLAGKSLYCGFYINELLMRLLQRNDPHEHLFHIYTEQIRQLTSNGIDEAKLRYFELDLLDELGYGIALDQDLDNRAPVDPQGYYHFIPERGLGACSAKNENAIYGQTLLLLQSRNLLLPEQLRQARNFLRTILGFYLGDKPLKSRELFRYFYNG
jgi:DNA repair protein RecO (recombination protein O)